MSLRISFYIIFSFLFPVTYLFCSTHTIYPYCPAHNIFLSGWVVSSTLAGATLGSFTAGALADKLGRTKTFMIDAIPLTIGAFLWSVLTLHFFSSTFGFVLHANDYVICGNLL